MALVCSALFCWVCSWQQIARQSSMMASFSSRARSSSNTFEQTANVNIMLGAWPLLSLSLRSRPFDLIYSSSPLGTRLFFISSSHSVWVCALCSQLRMDAKMLLRCYFLIVYRRLFLFLAIGFIAMQQLQIQCIATINIQMDDRYIKKSFVNGVRRFIIDKCIWKTVDNESQKKRPPNIKRYQHTVSVVNESLIIFGGSLKQSEAQKMMYSITLKSNEWRGWTVPEKYFRNSHSTAVYQNALYCFGGNDLVNEYNDLKKFQPYFNRWTQFQNLGNIPTPRSKSTLVPYIQHLFLIGGMNTFTGVVYEDAFLWKDSKWQKLVIQNPPSSRINYKIAKCGVRLFMFGGESTTFEEKYYNELYELIIDVKQYKLTFNQINSYSYHYPKQRSSHCMTSLSDNFFIVIGGETKDLENNSILGRLLRDIWVFDINEYSWLQIEPKNGPFKYISNSEVALYKNVLYMFGGINEHGHLVDDLTYIKFGEDQLVKSDICSYCPERQKKIILRRQEFPKKPLLSVGFLYNLALEIKFPFQAVALLTDSALLLNASHFNINYMKTMTDLIYLDITFDGKSFTKEQFYQFINHQNYHLKSQVNMLSRNIILGGFRLGKTILFITSHQNSRKVLLISADSKVAPLFDQTYNYYAYIENIEDGTLQTHDGLIQKNYIINILKGQLSNPYQILSSRSINRILILSHNCIMSINKIYYSELVSLKVDDIRLYKNPKKIEFLQKAGYQISLTPQISLRSYLSLLYANPSLTITVNQCQQRIQFVDYSKLLEAMCEQKIIIPLNAVQQLPPNIKLSLYFQENESIQLRNNGILLYYNDRLINRYECQFGSLFRDKFYRNRYKKIKNIWKILGVVAIHSHPNITLNIFQTDFLKTLSSQIQQLNQAIRKTLNHYQKIYEWENSSDNESISKKIKVQ